MNTSCANEEKVICYQLELRKYIADILTECSSCNQGENVTGAFISKVVYQAQVGNITLLFTYAEAN